MQIIDRLLDEIARLKSKLHYQERKAKEGLFGSSTPSSKIPIKESSAEEKRQRKGGAKKGHKGHGRKCMEGKQTDITETIQAPSVCPKCKKPLLELKDTRERTVADFVQIKVIKKVVRLERKKCCSCGKIVSAKPPGVMPRFMFSNTLLSYVATQHYFYGNTLGQISRQLGLPYGSLIAAMHKLAKIFGNVPEKLMKKYRNAPVKHADETGWRIDGFNGFGWIFCTTDMSIYGLKDTRSSSVVKEYLGEKPLNGVLQVDRYKGYNVAPCKIQHCYAHLHRKVKDLGKDFPDNDEIKCFVDAFGNLLSEAMKLRILPISDAEFMKKASELKRKIIEAVTRGAKHPGIQEIQNIFRENPDRMYHWATDRNIPADNNLAERGIRPLAIARKISHGSQSKEGANTRGILMTVCATLAKNNREPAQSLKEALDAFVKNPKIDLYKFLFPQNSS